MANFSKLYSSEDLVEQILSGLPPKSLMRFKCVCDLWCNLIKSPSFVAKHLSGSMRASSMPVLFKRPVPRDKENNIMDEKGVENDDDDVGTLLWSLNLCNEDDNDYLLSTVLEELNVPLPAPLKLKHSSDLTIAGHCDGIICLKLFTGNVILCNPAMKEFKLLPKSFLLLCNDDFDDLWSLSYELRYYTEQLGFGYDPEGKDYKVLRFVIYDESCYWFKAEVYTMDSNSWREIKTEYNNIIQFVNWSSDQPIYFNGICYWQVSGSRGEFILSFDMGNELFHEILNPDLPDKCGVVRLAVWKEFISLFTYQEEIVVPPSYDMWVMMDDLGDGKGSWTKYFTIGPVEGDKWPLLFWKGDQLLMESNDGQIVLYNIGTQILKYLPIHFIRDLYYSQELVYVNSIVSINGGNVLEDIHISAFYGNGKFYSINKGDVIDISAFYGITS
ncbi:putative F-box domain-containing protein [Rosa chinensis]|uniref:Putative F-box domain-containing protein n=1 Tax=Rosa chinensis TaxID=74649 RepID=A0A2P6R780_ROSCH|nr:F-box/kelch-repeat protein At3g06240 [Rosa chinensis]PRQ42296.1 putative F-box domain-containing protein [Rosa chinensis]